jgi:hypothetical protein
VLSYFLSPRQVCLNEDAYLWIFDSERIAMSGWLAHFSHQRAEEIQMSRVAQILLGFGGKARSSD